MQVYDDERLLVPMNNSEAEISMFAFYHIRSFNAQIQV